MKKIIYFSLIILSVICAACSSGEKALQNGDYYSAVLKSVDRLRSNPDKSKAQQTLLESYPLAVQMSKREIVAILNSPDPLKNTKSITQYQILNRMYNEINRCPAALRLLSNVQSFRAEEDMARQLAAPECYNLGLRELAKRTRNAAKSAYGHFAKANQFVPNFKDVNAKMQEAEYMATLKVIIEHIPVNSAKYSFSAEFFQDQVTQYITNNIRRQFVRFYTPKQAEMEKLEYPDHVIAMRFEDFVVGETHDTDIEKQVISADSVEVGTTKLKDGTSIKVYNKVKAKLHVHKREVISKGLLSLQIEEFENKRIINNKQMGGQYVWFSEWGHFNGDERALTKEELEICKNEPILPPARQDLFVEFTKPIYTQLTNELKRFYNRY
ncbi:hypothetical protein DWB61_16255 [Ancylomarina euxinus]|uniref:Lipoprotein n=1 Tax=Ancylomarina euxinus TaxID=2283627 RepID=A0A425XX68_9BACT|nr:hypothetical protein [Ancylomarina euxinus]MCZ4696185.1 hypothetical protein [Ancylomarina euxinus]MUP16451.1 hypothetical protein [Ancylomarina euxinus]RRG19240.1 hypothetical protein DWB61_16255 [Ancylomarina euxinus]